MGWIIAIIVGGVAGACLFYMMKMKNRVVDDLVVNMVDVGEETGELDAMLDSVADALDSDIDAIVAGLSAKIEVALLLVLGFVVGGLMLVLYMPILNLAATAAKGMGGG